MSFKVRLHQLVEQITRRARKSRSIHQLRVRVVLCQNAVPERAASPTFTLARTDDFDNLRRQAF